MLNEVTALKLLHSVAAKQEDTLLILLAMTADEPVNLAELKERGKRQGVQGISNWNISQVLGASKGKAVSQGGRWRVTAIGLSRVDELTRAAGISDTAYSAAPTAIGKRSSPAPARSCGRVFIGHGTSHVWLTLRDFVEKRLHLQTDEFNRISVAGRSTVARLEEMLNDAAFAFLVLTADDESSDGRIVARQNVVHEAGLFQGRLGFQRAIVLLENGCDEFSNLRGLTQIRFPKGNIGACFEGIREVLEREGVLATGST